MYNEHPLKTINKITQKPLKLFTKNEEKEKKS